jgi:hypothetical protein
VILRSFAKQFIVGGFAIARHYCASVRAISHFILSVRLTKNSCIMHERFILFSRRRWARCQILPKTFLTSECKFLGLTPITITLSIWCQS